jgi:hypothetical protein
LEVLITVSFSSKIFRVSAEQYSGWVEVLFFATELEGGQAFA